MIWLKDKRIWILLGFYGVLAILFHMCWLKLGGGDDYYFMTCLDDTSFGAFMVKRWYGWSSRLVIEGVLVLAEGGGSAVVKQELLEAVQALFPIAAHKVKIMKLEGAK